MPRQGGFGSIIKIKVNSTLTAIVHVEDHAFPEEEATTDEMTAHDSTDGYKERIKTGLFSLNPFEITVGWDRDETTHDALVAAYQSEDPVEMSVEDKKGKEVIAFLANVVKLGRIAEKDKHLKCKISIEPTGGPTGDTAESV